MTESGSFRAEYETSSAGMAVVKVDRVGAPLVGAQPSPQGNREGLHRQREGDRLAYQGNHKGLPLQGGA